MEKISFLQRYYACAITKEWEYKIKFLKNMDEMMYIIRKNPRIRDTILGGEIKKSSNEKYSVTKLLKICDDLVDCTGKFDNILVLLVGNFLQKCKIIEIQSKKDHFFIDRKSMEDIDKLANLIKAFLEVQEYFEQNVYPDSALFDKLVSNLIQNYDLDKKYLGTFNSSRRYSLKKRIEIWNNYLYLDDVYEVREKHGIPSNKAVKNILKPIQDIRGRPDLMKIHELFMMENNHAMTPNVLIQEIALLIIRYKLREELKKYIPHSKKYKKLVHTIKKELPGLLIT
ncbi:hypothetical protein AAA799D11_00150 [Marine Group I thaumarchaeote SCGC AAA799-D11]|uniref:Uncharacterized protein n=1 Tax=Marine Group I thaumarchaeote SCGC AAA799-D11 TaxID=1502291 RepID=A0A087RV49_9ARCH|nr:hypothetical protein AAA799D11_00150 [Marine Group I thaumarchaeote SCGC AAA799-D11]